MDLVQFQAKTLKFRSCLADLILGGKKTTTWRLYDDKDLKNGDLLNFRVWETGKDFAKAVITGINEKITTSTEEVVQKGDIIQKGKRFFIKII